MLVERDAKNPANEIIQSDWAPAHWFNGKS